METIAKQGEAVIGAHLEHLIAHREAEFYRQAIEFLHDHRIPVPRDKGRKATRVPGSPVITPRLPAPVPQAEYRTRHFSGLLGGTGKSRIRTQGMARSADNFSTRSCPVLRQRRPARLRRLRALCVRRLSPGFLKGQDRDHVSRNSMRTSKGYVAKLAAIFSMHTIRSITVLRMEVPCCGGVRHVVDQALAKAGKDIPVVEKTITITGGIR